MSARTTATPGMAHQPGTPWRRPDSSPRRLRLPDRPEAACSRESWGSTDVVALICVPSSGAGAPAVALIEITCTTAGTVRSAPGLVQRREHVVDGHLAGQQSGDAGAESVVDLAVRPVDVGVLRGLVRGDQVRHPGVLREQVVTVGGA